MLVCLFVLKFFRFIKIQTENESYVYWKCANEITKLPTNIISKDEAKYFIDMALKANDNDSNNIRLLLYDLQSKYYKKYEKNLEKALSFSLKSAEEGIFTSCLEVLALKYQLSKQENLIPIIKKFIEQKDKIKWNGYRLHIVKANYLMFVKNQVSDAMKIYREFMIKDCKEYFILVSSIFSVSIFIFPDLFILRYQN